MFSVCLLSALSLTQDDLKELGITALGHRMTVAKAIEGLQKVTHF